MNDTSVTPEENLMQLLVGTTIPTVLSIFTIITLKGTIIFPVIPVVASIITTISPVIRSN
ncbi:hypothetical protein K493DRAFT_362714 [Basidiobolus meristosporus CBS 931.73]|uniref:Uncharacterized protein n=1 Tax=Basidiobolus meristosporus CBS 931.73 TaxID=1314790 RepID=A0A1Y1WZV8_9FUNG|nr:hypothetical protein K493DRAFT_362714 [Basidiobolus meristosporus CBS 931.73]|eukprot:ORX79137.1 hypothetical protein K493DRAFT_362714 [Basidiobolus meristosporus CBS 931.73]